MNEFSQKNDVCVSMVGVDYSRANIEQRGLFSLSHAQYVQVANRIKDKFDVKGIIIISTCNRTEMWFSFDEPLNPVEVFCHAMQVDVLEYENLFIKRTGLDAVNYLFELVCGIHSQVFGEDQILTQIKTSLERARAQKLSDTVLEILFRTAVTAGKKVKTNVRLTEDNSSVAKKAVDSISDEITGLEGKRVLVIGNGQTGRLAVKLLVDKKATVFMTLRQYKKHDAIIPRGATVVPYEDRFALMKDMDIVVSATLSPNFTVMYEDVKALLDKDKKYTFVDLAVPRDIDTNIKTLPNVELFDVDTFSESSANVDTKKLVEVKDILLEYVDDFEKWYHFKDYIPSVQKISAISADNARGKLRKTVKSLDVDQTTKQELADQIGESTSKIVSSLMYGLREHLDRDVWLECMSALENSAEDMK